MSKELRKLIREMILMEAYEHTDDEVVTFEKIDLEYEFEKLNKLLFNGELQIVPLKWSVSKGKHGFVGYMRNRLTGQPEKITGLSMSKFFKIPYKMFKDTLAHEMIHVKNLQDDMKTNRPHYRSDAHGRDFMREASRIGAMGLGFNITVTGEGSFEVSDDIKGKDLYFAVLTLDGYKGGTHILVMTPKVFENDRSDLESLFNRLIARGKYRGVTFEYYKTNSPYFAQFSAQRSLKGSVTYSKSKDEGEIEKAKSLGTFVDKITLGRETADANNKKDQEARVNSGFYTEPQRDTLTKTEPPTFKKQEPIHAPGPIYKPTPTFIPKKEEPVSEKVKEQNKQIMSMFKASTDKMQQEALFNILKVKNDAIRDRMIQTYNMRFGKFGFIK